MFTVLHHTFTLRGPAGWKRKLREKLQVWSEAILAPLVSQTDLECAGPWQGDRQATVRLGKGEAANWSGNRAALWTVVGWGLSGVERQLVRGGLFSGPLQDPSALQLHWKWVSQTQGHDRAKWQDICLFVSAEVHSEACVQLTEMTITVTWKGPQKCFRSRGST